MKKTLFSTFISIAAILLICGSAFAENTTFRAQGRAVAPGIFAKFKNAYSYSYTYIQISNITDSAVECKVTILDHDGMDATSRGTIFSGDYVDGKWTPKPSVNGEFEIPAFGTRTFALMDRSQLYTIFGQATIEWKSSDPRMSKALVASLRTYTYAGSKGSTYSGAFPINNGQPF